MVDNIVKPFTFYTNTYAKANEVNADLDELYKGVNACINQTNINTTDIESVGEGKADQNGDASNTFNVANPTSGYNAVNRNSLWTYTRNSRWTINGLTVSYSKSSGTHNIDVSSGYCFDHNGEYMMGQASALTQVHPSLSDGKYYKVYIVGTKNTSTLTTSNHTIQVVEGEDNYPTVTSSQTYRLLATFYGSSSSGSVRATRLKQSGDTANRWLYNSIALVEGSSWSEGDHTLTIPPASISFGDGSVYEVLFSVYGQVRTTNPTLLRIKDLINGEPSYFTALYTREASNTAPGYAANIFSLPLTHADITFSVENGSFYNIYIRAYAYRRVL